MSTKFVIQPGALWEAKGVISGIPLDRVCSVYHIKNGKMSHVGGYTADGYVIHAQGHSTGVIREKLADFPWTHYTVMELTEAQAQGIVAFLGSMVGHPYIYGATMKECTPAYRRARIKQYPDYAANITKYCPVLSGKQATCSGCKYQGMVAFDCAQLTRWAYDSVDLYLPSGANNQYIENVPEGMFDGVEPAVGGVEVVKPAETVPDTLRIGATGSLVITLQNLLNQYGATLKVDGKFGPLTELAVEKYQQDNSLTVDGVVGPKTWAELLEADADPDEQPAEPVEAEPLYIVTIPDCTLVRANAIQGVYKNATITLQK